MIRGQVLKIKLTPESVGLPNLSSILAVYVYPDLYPDAYHKKVKTDGADSDFTPTEDGGYICTFSAKESAEFLPGSYTLEFRDVLGGTVFLKNNCFVVEDSAIYHDI